MQQEHTLIFWSKAKADETFDNAAERAYPLMQLFMTKDEDFFRNIKFRVEGKTKICRSNGLLRILKRF